MERERERGGGLPCVKRTKKFKLKCKWRISAPYCDQYNSFPKKPIQPQEGSPSDLLIIAKPRIESLKTNKNQKLKNIGVRSNKN